jgi:glycosyltransferase involved in cell wall biosynthesis
MYSRKPTKRGLIYPFLCMITYIEPESIVFACPVTHYGGAIRSSVALLRELAKRTPVFVLDFYGTCPEYLDDLKTAGIHYHVLLPGAHWSIIGGANKADRLLRLLRSSVEALKLIKRLESALLQIRPRCIWVNCEKSLFCVSRAIGDHFPVVIFIRGKHREPSILLRHDWKRLSRIVGNNRESLKVFEKYNWTRDMLCVARNGIDFEELQHVGIPAKPLPGQDSTMRVVMVATLIPLKAHATAIKGFARFCEVHGDAVLWICGDTPNSLSLDYEEGLHTLCRKLGVADRVHFLGWRRDVPEILKAANVFLLTSETEGLPRSMLEAMSLGLPPICTAVGGVPEVITDGVDGFLIDVNDADAVARALDKMQNETTRKRIGCAAKERVRTGFTIQNQAEMFLRIVDATQ